VDAALHERSLAVPQGYFLKWTGQYEELEKMAERMRVVIPATLAIIGVLLFLHFRNFAEVLIGAALGPLCPRRQLLADLAARLSLSTAVWWD